MLTADHAMAASSKDQYQIHQFARLFALAPPHAVLTNLPSQRTSDPSWRRELFWLLNYFALPVVRPACCFSLLASRQLSFCCVPNLTNKACFLKSPSAPSDSVRR